MEKHKFNIFPEMAAEEYEKLKSDLVANGFDSSQPIVIFEGAILDGWNRFQACNELGIAYVERNFFGTPIEAINFVMRTNTRRNLNSGQRAALATEAEEIIQFLTEATEAERREKQSENAANRYTKEENLACDKSLSQATESEDFSELIYELDEPQNNRQKNTVAHKIAQTFHTNRTYVREAQKIKQVSPETFQKVKSGEVTLPQAKKEVLTDEQKNIIQKKSEIKNSAGQRFRETTRAIRVQLDDIIRKDGLENLTATWDKEYKTYWLEELRSLEKKVGEFADKLETIICEEG